MSVGIWQNRKIEVVTPTKSPQYIPSRKLTISPLKMEGWNTIVSFWEGNFSGAMLVSGRVRGNNILSPIVMEV